MVDAIVRFVEDRALSERMGRAGRAYVVEHFDREALARSYLEILRSIAPAP